jgi:hypothetical protein
MWIPTILKNISSLSVFSSEYGERTFLRNAGICRQGRRLRQYVSTKVVIYPQTSTAWERRTTSRPRTLPSFEASHCSGGVLEENPVRIRTKYWNRPTYNQFLYLSNVALGVNSGVRRQEFWTPYAIKVSERSEHIFWAEGATFCWFSFVFRIEIIHSVFVSGVNKVKMSRIVPTWHTGGEEV